MKVSVIAIALNEAEILPHFLRWYENIADEIHIWDNESTDNSREICESHPLVHFHSWGSGGETNDGAMLKIKNQEYQKLAADFSIVVDCDEFLFHPTGLREFLGWRWAQGVTLPRVTGFDMIHKTFPADMSEVRLGLRAKNFDKR